MPNNCAWTIVTRMERVLGIGGFFFRAKDPEALAAWYERALGIPSMATRWSWEQEAGQTVFAPFPADTDYFGSMQQQVMLNFRVPNLDAMLAQLKEAGATWDDVVFRRMYAVDVPAFMEIVRDPTFPLPWHPDRPSPSTLIGVTALSNPGFLLEIEIVAMVDG